MQTAGLALTALITASTSAGLTGKFRLVLMWLEESRL